MKTALLTLAFAVLAFLPNAQADDHAMKGDMKKEAGVKTVLFYSDTCGSCKVLDPNINAALEAVNKEKMEFVKLDFSSKEKIAATKILATEKGVDSVLQKYGAKTGFAVLLNAEGEEVMKFKVDHTAADIAGEMAKAIATKS